MLRKCLSNLSSGSTYQNKSFANVVNPKHQPTYGATKSTLHSALSIRLRHCNFCLHSQFTSQSISHKLSARAVVVFVILFISIKFQGFKTVGTPVTYRRQPACIPKNRKKTCSNWPRFSLPSCGCMTHLYAQKQLTKVP